MIQKIKVQKIIRINIKHKYKIMKIFDVSLFGSSLTLLGIILLSLCLHHIPKVKITKIRLLFRPPCNLPRKVQGNTHNVYLNTHMYNRKGNRSPLHHTAGHNSHTAIAIRCEGYLMYGRAIEWRSTYLTFNQMHSLSI